MRKGFAVFCLLGMLAADCLGQAKDDAQALTNSAVAEFNRGEKQKAVNHFVQALPLWRAQGDRAGEATTLDYLGDAYRDLEERQNAVDTYLKALPLWHGLGRKQQEAEDLNNVAWTYNSLGDKPAAIEYYGKTASIDHELGDRGKEAANVAYLGLLNSEIGEKQKALDYYGKALALWVTLKDVGHEADVLNGIGTIHIDLGEYEKALQNLDQALPLFQAVGNKAGEAAVESNMSIAFANLGQESKAVGALQKAEPLMGSLEPSQRVNLLLTMGRACARNKQNRKALEYFEQALALESTAQERTLEPVLLANIGNARWLLGEKQKALDALDRAQSLVHKMDVPAQRTTLVAICVDYSRIDAHERAIGCYGQALLIERAAKDRRLEAGTLDAIGTEYRVMRENQKSLDYYSQALALDRTVQDRAGEATTLNNIGNVNSNLGEMQLALENYTQALELYRGLEDQAGQATELMGIGNTYSDLGEKKKALNYLEQSLSLVHAAKDSSAEATTLVNVAGIYSDLGQTDKSMEYYKKALPLFEAAQDHKGEASSLNGIGLLFDQRGDVAKALDSYGQVLTLARAEGDRAGEAETLNNIGLSYSHFGNKQKAINYFEQVLPLWRSVGDRVGEAKALENLSGVMDDSGQADFAIWLGKVGVNLFQGVRRNNQDLEEEFKGSYASTVKAAYHHLAGLLMLRGRFGEAQEVFDLLKDSEVARFVFFESSADRLDSATLLGREKKALDGYERVIAKIVAADPHKTDLLRSLFDEQQKIFAVQQTEEIQVAKGLQEKLRQLGPGAVAIYTMVTPEKYIALLVTGDTRQAYTTAIKETELNAGIFAFYQMLRNKNSHPLEPAQELYRVIFPEDLRKKLKSLDVKTIMWSHDSNLRYIPFAALHDGQQYLVESYRQSLFTPGSIAHLADEPAVKWDGIGFGVTEGMSPLPAVGSELYGIFAVSAASKAPVPGTVRLNADFTRARFEKDLQQRRKVVHIATHFDAQPGAPANSKLLLGDGPMSLAEIAAKPKLFEGVELLTLSACSTAFTNNQEDGRELDSFGTVAQSLGAKSVIASLWSVDDPSTAALMQKMYSLRQNTPGMTKAEALRVAQEQMATGTVGPGGESGLSTRGTKARRAREAAKDWTHPYYWAPFILIGNWK